MKKLRDDLKEACEQDVKDRGKCEDEDDNCPCPQHRFQKNQQQQAASMKKLRDDLKEACEQDFNDRGKCEHEDNN
jgi:hypothetical protein